MSSKADIRYGRKCPYLCYGLLMALTFHSFDPATQNLSRSPGAVEEYPGGDAAVRGLQPTSDDAVPVAWSTGGRLDFAALAQWVAFHDGSAEQPVLVLPYLPSARGDHDATRDAQTVARLTAATGIRDVIAADPHSAAWGDAAADCGLTVHAISAADLIAGSTLTAAHWQWTGVIAPDKGAVGRAGQVARALGVPLRTAGKVRDSATGKLSGFTPPEGITTGRFLVVDDICDGGGTFASLAQIVHTAEPAARLHLWVTHGLFTGRWRENLAPNFDSITAANSNWSEKPEQEPRSIRRVSMMPHVIDALTSLRPATTTAA